MLRSSETMVLVYQTAVRQTPPPPPLARADCNSVSASKPTLTVYHIRFHLHLYLCRNKRHVS